MILDESEQSYLATHRAHEAEWLVEQWRMLAGETGLTVTTLGEAGDHSVILLESKAAANGGGLYLSAGIHGDEPAAGLGLLEWARRNGPFLAEESVVIAPCLNPWGLAHNLRTDQNGDDLNRRFEPGGGPVIEALLRHIAGRRFAATVSLHEDYDARGVYLYELADKEACIGERLLSVVEEVLPRHHGMVDGHEAPRGVIRREDPVEEIVRRIEGMPEAIYLNQHHTEVALTFETPSEFSLYQRVLAQARFLEAVAGMFAEGESLSGCEQSGDS